MTHPQLSPDPKRFGGHPSGEQTLAWWALLVVGVVYLVAQLVLFPLRRSPGWDESVYLSQVMPDTEALFFGVWRARGITLLIAPVTSLGGSVEHVRMFLLMLSAASMTATFGLWIPLVGLAAPVGAFAFSFSWLSLLNGSEVMPNFWAAVLGLAAAGLIARRLEGGGTRYVVLASGVLGAMALVRPTDAAVVACAIGVYVLLVRRASRRVLVPLGLGLVVGWLPWAIEMSLRFGGPIDALKEAGGAVRVGGPSLAQNVVQHLVNTGGGKGSTDVPAAGVLWWSVLIFLAIVALARGVTTTDRTVALISCFGAVALATEYMTLVSGQAARFLLPAYAFASLAAAIGLVSLLRGSIVVRAAGAIVLVLVIPWAIWQSTVADQIRVRKEQAYLGLSATGEKIRQLVGGRPCSFVSPGGYPEIQLASGCVGKRLPWPRGPSEAELEDLVRSGGRFFVILRRPASPASPLSSVTPVRARVRGKTWFIYEIYR